MSRADRSRSGRRRLGGAGYSDQRVADWPTYLLKKIPAVERERLSAVAAELNVSVSDAIRAELCARYRMDCPPASYRYDDTRDTGAATILLRLQPLLHRALERESARTGHSKRYIILETIASHNTKGEPS